MYNEISRFMQGKDPAFERELLLLAPSSPKKVGFADTENELHILKKYHQSEAYKRLVKRQEQGIRRLERIKANFERKRKQVDMVAVSRCPTAGLVSEGLLSSVAGNVRPATNMAERHQSLALERGEPKASSSISRDVEPRKPSGLNLEPYIQNNIVHQRMITAQRKAGRVAETTFEDE